MVTKEQEEYFYFKGHKVPTYLNDFIYSFYNS